MNEEEKKLITLNPDDYYDEQVFNKNFEYLDEKINKGIADLEENKADLVEGKVPLDQMTIDTELDPDSLAPVGNKFLKRVIDKKADLDENGKIPEDQLPSYAAAVVEYDTYADFPEEGEAGKIYIDIETNTAYRWSGSTYDRIGGEITSKDVTGALGYTPLDAVGVQLNGKDLVKDSNNKINIVVETVDSYTKTETAALLRNKVGFAEYKDNKISFYDSSAKNNIIGEIDLPVDMVVDNIKTKFSQKFKFDTTTYPNTENPNLDGKPVLVLAIKTSATADTFSFLNMESLVDVYTGGTTKSAIISVDQGTGVITNTVRISAETGNKIVQKDDGLFVPNQSASQSASDVSYSNTTSKLNATTVQAAIDETLDVANKKYTKPSTGIPSTDLAQAVKNSLTKANTALQEADKIELQDYIYNAIARLDINSDLKVLGLDADFENNSYTKIGGCIDKETIFGSIGRVNLSDAGKVLARYGDSAYKEDGTNGQVMVEIPRIYYMVEPVKLGTADCAAGQSLMHGKYYISLEPRPGMKLHPAFEKANSDKIYVSAFEGYVSGGKLNSIKNVLPTVSTTRMTFEGYAKARGTGWHILDVDINALVQLLVVIDIGSFDMQTHIGKGVTNSSNTGRFYTGSTIGNTTGSATSTKDTSGTAQTAADKTSVNWRGIENIYGNVWKFVIGANVLGNGSQAGGQIYVCGDTNYDEAKTSGNYYPTNLYAPNSANYIKYFGYNEAYDYLMCPTTVGGTSTNPIGDYSYSTANLNGNRIALVGGRWNLGSPAGGFSLDVSSGTGSSYSNVGARSVYFS